MKGTSTLASLILLAIHMSAVLLPHFQHSYAQGTSVYIDPSFVNIPFRRRANVTVMISNVTDLYTWQIKLHFNTSIVNVTDIVLPPDHVFDGQVFVPGGPIFKENYVQYGLTLLGSGWSFNGNGPLCQMQLEGLAIGNSTLQFDPIYTFLLNQNLSDIPSSKNGGLAAVVPSAAVHVHPEYAEVLIEGAIDVDVIVSNVTDLYVWQVKIHFDSSVLTITDINLPSGHVFDGRTFVPGGPTYGPNDVAYRVSLLGSGWSFNGSGVLCKIRLEGLILGNSTLEFDSTDTYLMDYEVLEIPISTRGGIVATVLGTCDVAVMHGSATTVCGAYRNYSTHRTVMCQNYTVTFNVTIGNLGDFNETNVEVRISANGTEVANQTVHLLMIKSNLTLSFVWDTTGWPKGNYTIDFNATATGDADDSNDSSDLPWPIALVSVGDINNDLKVDMKDIALAARAFGATVDEDGYWHEITCDACPHTCNSDISDDGKIDMKDISTIAKHFAP